jgi:hypothetical protein
MPIPAALSFPALAAYLAASSSGPLSNAEPIAAQISRAFPDLPPEPLDAPSPPAREPEEYARHAWELSPELGLATPFCRGGTTGDACQALGLGFAGGGQGLFRLAPHVALGAAVHFTSLRADTRSLPEGTSDASVTTGWIGVIARGYFLDRGALDPYLQAGFGRGTVEQRYASGEQSISLSGAAPATMAGAGLDGWISPSFKIGALLAYHWTFLGDLRTCDRGPLCETVQVTDVGAATSALSLALTATLAFGHEM